MAPALAGPLLIVGVTLFALRAFAFGGQLTTGDALSLFLPTYCHLGNVLAAGHIPAWNPGTFTGLPFAGDPQSGYDGQMNWFIEAVALRPDANHITLTAEDIKGLTTSRTISVTRQ